MALVATVTPTTRSKKPTRYHVSIAGASVAAATEVEITGLPTHGRILLLREALVSGSGTTIDPVLGTATNPATSALVENDTAASAVVLQSNGGPVHYYSATGSLFYRSVPDSGADNVTAAEILVLEGWGS